MRQSERSWSEERKSEVRTNSFSYSRRRNVGDRAAIHCPPKPPYKVKEAGSKEQDNKESPASL